MTSIGRWSAVSGLGLISFVVAMFAASCGADRPPSSEGATNLNVGAPSSCATPQMGCPCTPGTVAACGVHVNGDQNFIYCYQGTRVCGPSGVYGDCLDGTVVAKAVNSSLLHTSSLGAVSACSAPASTSPLKTCVGGKKDGDFCTTNADCVGGKKKCNGSSDNTNDCKDDGDCNLQCGEYLGKCAGGSKQDNGCNASSDCPGSTCSISAAAGICTISMGICKDGSKEGEVCNSDADCGGNKCEVGHGNCLGGKRNGKKCKHNSHCKGGSCTGEDAGATTALDPCDPYCNVASDTPTGFDAGPNFVLKDGGANLGLSVNVCGDGTLKGFEECDDGNVTNGDGCSSTCSVEFGFQCPNPGTPCIASTCGNGIKEGAEQCDDGNIRPYDGCSPTCRFEVNCPGGACVATCGDGLKFPTEACDDGNLRDGDGCSSTCTVEPGITCTTVTLPPPATIDVPVIYRDFTPTTNVDFEHTFPWSGVNYGLSTGIVKAAIGADGEPVFNTTGSPAMVTSATTFNQWYHDNATVNKVILGKYLRLALTAGAYVFDSANDTPYGVAAINCGAASSCKALTGFYPLNGQGYGNYAATAKNYHFTSEARYPFTYKGGEVLSFTGDDDVWVFINGKLVVDLGGVHGASTASYTLTAANATTLGLTVGNTYQIAVFQAERHTTESNYKLTLQGFTQTVSQCLPPVNLTAFRDYEATCGPGTEAVWQLFRWQASVPAGSIDFRAATAATQAALPGIPPAAAPVTVPIGSATPANSPAAGPLTWVSDTSAGVPVPVSQHLKVEGNTTSKRWLRVYMTFNPAAGSSPRLDQWQQLYDCIPKE